MINRLNNTNGKESNAVINKQIKDLQDDVSQLKSDVAQDQVDIAALDAALDNKVSKASLASEVDTASLKATSAKIDTIESKNANDVTVNDNLKVNGKITATGQVSATSFKANGVDIVNDYTCKTACAIADASNAVCTANDALACAQNVKCELDDYKDDIANEVTTSCANIGSASIGDEDVNTLTVNNCAYINKASVDVLHNSNRVMKSFIEPTEKDATEWYHISLPTKFDGNAMLVALDENDTILFSASFITTLAQNTEGEHVIVYSTNVLDNFKQILVDIDLEQVSFITKAQIKRLYYSYDSLGEQLAPAYEIVADLSGFDYAPYEKVFDTVKTNQTVVLGNENTLNGGMTVVGTLKAAIDSSGQPTIDSKLYLQEDLIVGYNNDTGSYETSGVCGGLVTFNDKSTTGICAPNNRPNWINGCPRSVPRKTVCCGDDGAGHDYSDLEFEAPVDNTTITPLDNTSDKLITERTVANYDGTETHDVGGVSCTTYPIKHLGDNTCVHGNAIVENDLIVDENISAGGYAHVGGDIRSEGEIIAGKDMVVHGNLFVNGTTTTTSEKQVASTGDYFVAREGAQTGLSNTGYSGIVINNYNGNDCNAFIGADRCGEVRVGKEGYTNQTVYTNISAFGGVFYDHLTHTTTTGPLHLITNVDAVELSNVVWNTNAGNEILANSYYHWEGTHYFGPLSIVNGRFDLGSMITDAADIAVLDALTPKELVYYNSVTDNELAGNDVNQPVLTRNEKGNLSCNAILKWDSDYNRADATPMASQDGQVLVSCVQNGNTISHKWEQRVSMVNRSCDNDYPVAICTGTNYVGRSTCCPITYNPATGQLKACSLVVATNYISKYLTNTGEYNQWILLQDITAWYNCSSGAVTKLMNGRFILYRGGGNITSTVIDTNIVFANGRQGCPLDSPVISRQRFSYTSLGEVPGLTPVIICENATGCVYTALRKARDTNAGVIHFDGIAVGDIIGTRVLGGGQNVSIPSGWTHLYEAPLGGTVSCAETAKEAEGFRNVCLPMSNCCWIKIGSIENAAPATIELVLGKDWNIGQPGTSKLVIQTGGCYVCIPKVEETSYNNSPFSCIRFGRQTGNTCQMDIYVKYGCACCNRVNVSYCVSSAFTFTPSMTCVSDACAIECTCLQTVPLHSSGHYINDEQFDTTCVQTVCIDTCRITLSCCNLGGIRLIPVTLASESQGTMFEHVQSAATWLGCKAYPVWGYYNCCKLDYFCKVSEICYSIYSGNSCIGSLYRGCLTPGTDKMVALFARPTGSF